MKALLRNTSPVMPALRALARHRLCIGSLHRLTLALWIAAFAVPIRAEEPADTARAKVPVAAAEDATSDEQKLIALLDRAIEAHGGAKNILRPRTGRAKSKGTGAFVPGATGDFTLTDTFQLPEKLRREASAKLGDESLNYLFIGDGHECWSKIGSHSRRIPNPSGTFNPPPFNVLASLVQVRNAGYSLSRPKEDKAGRTTIELWKGDASYGTIVVDDNSHYAVETTKYLFDQETLKDITARTVYQDFKKTDGLAIPMHITCYKDGTRFLEFKFQKIEILTSLEPHLFDVPKTDESE